MFNELTLLQALAVAVCYIEFIVFFVICQLLHYCGTLLWKKCYNYYMCVTKDKRLNANLFELFLLFLILQINLLYFTIIN